MPTEIHSVQGITVAKILGMLDEAEGAQLLAYFREQLLNAGKVVVDGSEVTGMDGNGLLSLVTLQRRLTSVGLARLPLAGFSQNLWSYVVQSGQSEFFDYRSSVDEALHGFGIVPTGGAGSAASTVHLQPTPEGPAVPIPIMPASNSGAWKREEEMTNLWQRPGSNPVAPASVEPQPGMPHAAPASPPPQLKASDDEVIARKQAPHPAKKSSSGVKIGVILVLLCAFMLFLAAAAAAAWWFLLRDQTPTLALAKTELMLTEGNEVDEGYTVEVTHGVLEVEGLPDDLVFVNSGSESATASATTLFGLKLFSASKHTYELSGQAKEGAKISVVKLVAVGEKERSAPQEMRIIVKAKPLEWKLATLSSLGLKAGKAITGKSSFVAGAAKLAAENLPKGLSVKKASSGVLEWSLVGTPETAGESKVKVTAMNASGELEEKEIVLKVAEGSPPPTQPLPGPGGVVTQQPPSDTEKEVDDGMRNFFLNRIDQLPDRYTPTDRENLRMVVAGLTKAEKVFTVFFEKDGQVEVSTSQADAFKQALKKSSVAELLKNDGCQIIVVGYASKKGSVASNIRISKERAKSVDELLKKFTNRNADICGDYGPTDVVSTNKEEENRVVEVYAGTMTLPDFLKPKATDFKDDFNRRHGFRE